MRKKILIVAPEFLPIPNVCGGAVETLITEFLKSIKYNEDYEFVVYSSYNEKLKNINFDEYKNCSYRYIQKNNKLYKLKKYILAICRRLFPYKVVFSYYDYSIFKDLKKRKELRKYDLIVLENGMRATKLFRKKLSGKIVLHLHNDKVNKNIKNAYEIINYTDEIWTVSKFLKNRIEEVGYKKKIKVLYNGVDLEKFTNKYTKIQKKKFAEKYGINLDKHSIIYSGRLMPEKGVLELVNAFNKFIQIIGHEEAQLIIAGQPDGKNAKSYFQKLKEASKDINDIKFLGKIDYYEMPILYSLANVQVVPSIINEAFGMILIEGLSNGLVIIATNSGGIPELINNQNGIIVDRENLEENLLNALTKVYNDKELAKQLSVNGPEFAKKFSKDNYCDTFKKYINEIIQ